MATAGSSLATTVPTRTIIEKTGVSVYRIPTDRPEADGTYAWDSTTMVLVELAGGGETGIGFTYADRATAEVIRSTLLPIVELGDPFATAALHREMLRAVRNLGQRGIATMAISAVDIALWDLKARILGVPLVRLLGDARPATPIYGSGGFTSDTVAELQAQLAGWVADGIPRVKMKVGTHPDEDVLRVRAARAAIGSDAELFVDANGAYHARQAAGFAQAFHESACVTWFEEPVIADDLAGLRQVRDHAPSPMEIAAGEYGYLLNDFHRLLDHASVDVLQADMTRCGGVTGFLAVAALAEARNVPLSAHCAPALHAHLCAALPVVRHIEYFHDHVRIEQMLFDGVPALRDGALVPDRSQPGLGLVFRASDAAPYAD